MPAGWAFVSEQNGLYIRKKLLESVSPTISLLRADKVVQGLAAEELLASSRPPEAEAAAVDAAFGSSLHTYATGGTAPVGVALTDVNADNRLDVVVSNSATASSTVGVLLNSATAPGTLAPAVVYPCGGISPNLLPWPTSTATIAPIFLPATPTAARWAC